MEIQRINPREWNCSAAVFGDLVFLSGTVADDKSRDMEGQTAEVLKKIDAVLAKAGTNKSRILSATVYMADAGLKDEMNKAWMAWVEFADPHRSRRRAHSRHTGRDHGLCGEVAAAPPAHFFPHSCSTISSNRARFRARKGRGLTSLSASTFGLAIHLFLT